MREIWPKYMQACLNEFAHENHTSALILEKEEFERLPDSSLNNIVDYKLFEDYVKCDLEIECIRNAKYN